jgi:hypothetical protein
MENIHTRMYVSAKKAVIAKLTVALERKAQLVEVSQSLGRHRPAAHGVIKTILPKWKLIHSRRVRHIRGFEKMRIQGMWIGTYLEQQWSSQDLSTLAGNACDCFCCGAATLTALALLGARPDGA